MTIIGDTSAPNDYAQNLVTISSASSPLTISTYAAVGITWRNINFICSTVGATCPAVTLRGTKNAFYNCQLISAGTTTITASPGAALIANSYIEGQDKLFYKNLGLYVFNSIIVATASNANIIYSYGTGTPLIASQVVIDSGKVIQKAGTTNSYVYLAANNGAGSQAVYKYVNIAGLIAPAGTRLVGTNGFYGEYATTGAGSYGTGTGKNDVLMTASQLANFTIDAVFANTFAGLTTPDSSWVDSTVSQAIALANAGALNQASSTTLSTTSTTTTSTVSSVSLSSTTSTSFSTPSPLVVSGTSSSTTISTTSTTSSTSFVATSTTLFTSTTSSSDSASSSSSSISSISSSDVSPTSTTATSSLFSSVSTITVSSSSSSTLSTTSAASLSPSTTSTSTGTSITTTTSSSSSSSSASPVCILPSGIPSTAKVVGPVGSCATYNNISAAVAVLPADSTTQYIYVLAGMYNEQIASIGRVGPTIFRGESTSPLSQAANMVTVQYSGSILSSQGSAEPYAVFRSTQYAAKKYAFYNINFVNTATITPNYVAIAMDIKAQQVGFYSCGFVSGQGTFLANYGTFYLSGCRIEGSSDFVWGYGAAYISNCQIVSNTPAYAIAAHNYLSTYASQLVFDQCTFVPKSTTNMRQSTYLGRDYSTSSAIPSSRVAIMNSYLDDHINPTGWLIQKSSTNVTFVEYNNTGPGALTAKRASVTQLLSDSSVYSAANVLGDLSWVDTSALTPFAGFPNSMFDTLSSSTTYATMSSTSSSSVTSSPTTSVVPPTSTYVVSKNANTTQYSSISAAVNALPNDGATKTILVMSGTYEEQLNINRTGKVILIGQTTFVNDYSQNQVTVQFNYGVSTSAGQNELTPVLNTKKNDGSGIAVYNINFVNTFPQTRNYAALAADFYGTNMAAYGCSFIGFQDTLLANQGTQLFSNCYIEGSVDFVWGFSKAYFHQCYIAHNTAGGSISAQSNTAAVAGGYVFDSCMVTYTSSYGSTFNTSFLGRPYSNYSVAVYKNSYIDKHISSLGWTAWQTNNPQTNNVLFGEYNNTGPSAWTATTRRATFAANLTDTQAAAYELGTFMGSTSWIDMTAYNYPTAFALPSWSGTTIVTTPVANATTSRPTSGTVPPTGAVLVSVDAAVKGSFANLTAALASLPADSTSQTIFVYPGSYYEQFSINRPGPVVVIGYQSGNVGQSYTNNQVTFTYARGLSVVAPVAAGHTNAETAVVATASNKLSFYNVNFVNTDNLDGSIPSYVTLAGSVYGDQIGFYGCSFVGWQDTLLTGNPTGYAYYESSYIEGAIDFIWGYSLSYFKGCTLAAKRAKSCITAQSRASSSATGGYVFDQCLFTAAASANTDLTQLVYLGRPYSQYARVIVKYSYLDSTIQPAGWKAWSTTDPRLDYATFAEFQNIGPGNWENNAAARIAFGNATLLSSDTYSLTSVMASTSWIDMTYWNSIVTPQPASSTGSTGPSTNTTTTTNATADVSTTPLSGSCIVSKVDLNVTSYKTIAGCIAALPSGSSVATIFIYPGIYNEQLVFNRSGATIFRGYADSPSNYESNQVTITNSVGVDTQSDQSNSDSATFYSRGKNVKFYNINLVNTYGTAKNYASLAFAIGNNGNASFYGCQIIGNQDTLNINTGCSVFTYNSYVEGSVDFIWGSGSGYFLASTIAPNTPGISITADKRASNTSAGGIVFDQCTVSPSTAAAQLPDMTGSISLGRPWNANARVAYIKTYLCSCVSPAGWQQWSSSSPNTDGVFFGEYKNTGAGAVSTSRAAFSHQMSDAEATSFEIANFFSSTSWIDFSALAIQPFSVVPEVVVTYTVAPTGPVPTVTVTNTQTLVSTYSVSLLVLTKSTTQKISTVTTITQPDKYLSTTGIVTSSSTMTITPAAKSSIVTVNNIITTTSTISAADVTEINFITSKVTATVTSTSPPTTLTQTQTVTEIQTITSTPKVVSQLLTSTVSTTIISTSTPKTQTTTLKTTTTSTFEEIAPTPYVTVISKSTTTLSIIRTSTPKAVTETTIVSTTVPAGPTVTSTAKNKITVLISSTSLVTKTAKTTTTLSCTPVAKKRRGLEEREGQATITVTTTYTLPQTTATAFTSTSISSTKTVAAVKTTETDVFTSFIYSTITVTGQTYTITATSTKLVLKTVTLPTVTQTSTSYIEGTVVKTTSLKPTTSTLYSTVTSTVKTSTTTLAGATIQAGTTTTKLSSVTITLPTQTIISTTTTTKSFESTTILPTPTTTVTNLAVQSITITFTPDAVTRVTSSTFTVSTTTTTTLPIETQLVTVTSTSRVPTPTTVITNTTTKTTTVKSTISVTSTATRYAKGSPTCS